MKSIRDALIRGVWGPQSKLGNNLNYGGPDCAAEAPVWFKVAVVLVLVSLDDSELDYANLVSLLVVTLSTLDAPPLHLREKLIVPAALQPSQDPW